jgi:hypothetical protein
MVFSAASRLRGCDGGPWGFALLGPQAVREAELLHRFCAIALREASGRAQRRTNSWHRHRGECAIEGVARLGCNFAKFKAHVVPCELGSGKPASEGAVFRGPREFSGTRRATARRPQRGPAHGVDSFSGVRPVHARLLADKPPCGVGRPVLFSTKFDAKFRPTSTRR